MTHPSLENKPLGEVIFDLRWKLEKGDSPGFEVDPGYSIFQSKYMNFALDKNYPYLEKLPASKAPEDMTGYTPRFRFRKEENAYPLTQIGPGILSVNDTKNYKWEKFKPLILESVDTLLKEYPSASSPLVLKKVVLKYVNLIPYEYEEFGNSLLNFLNEKLHLEFIMKNPNFSESKQDTLSALRFTFNYKLQNPNGIGAIDIGNGSSEGKNMIRLGITISSDNERVPKTIKDFEKWLTEANEIAYQWFTSFCEGELMDTFK